jgi:hypothetical protein
MFIDLSYFSIRCPYLEKVTWSNTNNIHYGVYNGFDMRYSNNLKEIIIDDSVFFCKDFIRGDENINKISDLVNHQDIFMFHHCCKKAAPLERVSVRNTEWPIRNVEWQQTPPGQIVSPQNALIKFVRNAPSTLRWFRSNLKSRKY